jgi:hypothetical protein
VKFDTGKDRSSDHNLTLFGRYSLSALPESRPSQNFSIVSAAVCNSANLAAVLLPQPTINPNHVLLTIFAMVARKCEENNMEYRNLGRSGLKVSPLCLGTMMFSGPTDEPTSGRMIARAREAGINFIDTADAYNNGRAEEVVGRAIAAERSVTCQALLHSLRRGPDEQSAPSARN